MMESIDEKKKGIYLHSTPPTLFDVSNESKICAFSYYDVDEGPSIQFYDLETEYNSRILGGEIFIDMILDDAEDDNNMKGSIYFMSDSCFFSN